MRFENSALKMFQVDPFHLNDLRSASGAAHDSNGQSRNAGKSRQKTDDRVVSLSANRRSGDVQTSSRRRICR
jgi:hypothetical protein